MVTLQRLIEDYQLCLGFIKFLDISEDCPMESDNDKVNEYFKEKEYEVRFKTEDGKITRPIKCKIKRYETRKED